MPHGISNPGNSCFINSALQVLLHIPEMNEFVLNNGATSEASAPIQALYWQWKDVVRTYTTAKGTGFLNIDGKDGFYQEWDQAKGQAAGLMHNVQSDSGEFLKLFIGCLEEATNRRISVNVIGTVGEDRDKLAVKCYLRLKEFYDKEYSPIKDLITGIGITNMFFNGRVINQVPDIFQSIEVDIEANIKVDDKPVKVQFTNLMECLEEYTKKQDNDDYSELNNDGIPNIAHLANGKWQRLSPEETSDSPPQQQTLFWSLPKILTIVLKRFLPNGQKNISEINFPITGLDLSKYISGYEPEKYKYDLFGVIEHAGKAGGGHYIAKVRESSGQWFLINDDIVQTLPETYIVNPAQAYILFYRMNPLAEPFPPVSPS